MTASPLPLNFVRGQGFRSALYAVEQLLGPDGRQQTLAAVSPELSEAFRYGKIVAPGWFPIEWYIDLHRAAASVAGARKGFHRNIGQVSARHDMQGVYRFMLGFTTPTFMLSHVGRVIGTFIKNVQFQFLERATDHVVIRFDIPGATRVLWEDVAGGTEVLLEFCGAKQPDVFMRVPSVSGTADMHASWS